MATKAVWNRDFSVPDFSSLDTDLFTDVCVIGGGIGGVTTALLLTRQGLKVCLLEARTIGGGETGRTTAHIVTAHDDRYSYLQSIIGDRSTSLVAKSYLYAIDVIEDLAQNFSPECQFHRLNGYLFLNENDNESTLQNELTVCKKIGLSDVERISCLPGLTQYRGGCLTFPRQATFHPLKYLNGLLQEYIRCGGKVFCHTRAVKFENTAGTCTVETDSGTRVRCKKIVVATNSPTNTLFGVHTKQAPYRTFVLAAEFENEMDDALYWETGWPYHYIRFHTFGPVNGHPLSTIIVGGEDHKTGHADDGAERLNRLEIWARERFPSMGQVLHKWSGQVMESIDGLPFLGEDREDIYIISGDSGTGMTHTTLGATLITDLIMDKKNEWADIYSPRRRSIKAAGEYANENMSAAKHMLHWILPDGHHANAALGPDEARITRSGINRVGIYKSVDGKTHALSLACKHVGCPLNWNSLERSWDCPCHGSRYRFDGQVICAPAHQELSPIDIPDIQQDVGEPPSNDAEKYQDSDLNRYQV